VNWQCHNTCIITADTLAIISDKSFLKVLRVLGLEFNADDFSALLQTVALVVPIRPCTQVGGWHGWQQVTDILLQLVS
jgi:hypothetical protein